MDTPDAPDKVHSLQQQYTYAFLWADQEYAYATYI